LVRSEELWMQLAHVEAIGVLEIEGVLAADLCERVNVPLA
jgi:hypothetical protein